MKRTHGRDVGILLGGTHGATADYVASWYHRRGNDVPFHEILNDLGPLTDDELAELIEEDGRNRIARGGHVRLDRYLHAIPDLLSRMDPLDAAVDVTLRSLSGSARIDDASVETLVAEYPHIEQLIREAALLNNTMLSTSDVRRDFAHEPPRLLPQDFGPSMPGADGERRYELQRLMGAGAFGQVYLAVDRLLSEEDRPALVAIKILKLSSSTSRSRRQLIEEAKKARRVDHLNVVRVLDRGLSQDNDDFITYELVDGGDLFQWLRDRPGRAEPREAVALIAQIASGVQAAHAAGLVHCDLQPGNIILTPEGVPKVGDFGIAIRTEEQRMYSRGGARINRVLGNRFYMSPEQYRGEEGSQSIASDVYALGGILFTLLTRQLPNGSTPREVEQNHAPEHSRTEAPSVRSMRPEIDRDLDAICRRAMDPLPEQRYSSAGSFADDLDAWLRYEPIRWTRPSGWRIAQLWARRRPGVAVAVAAVVLTVIAGTVVAFYLMNQRNAQELRALEAEHQADVERVRAEEKKRAFAQTRDILHQAFDRTHQTLDNRASTQALPVMWNMEYLFASSALGRPDDTEMFHQMRLRTVERLIEQAHAEGRGDHIDTMLWRTTLAFWLVSDGELDSLARAQPILADIREEWSDRLSGDRWLDFLDAIELAAIVKHAAHAHDSELAAETASQLETTLAALGAHEESLRSDDVGSPLHVLVLESMIECCDLLGRPEMRDLVEELAEHRRGNLRPRPQEMIPR